MRGHPAPAMSSTITFDTVTKSYPAGRGAESGSLADAQAKQAAVAAAAKAGLPAALSKFLAAVAPEQMEAAATELKGYVAGPTNPLTRNEPTPHAATSADSADSNLDAIGARLFRK